jgi:putative CocE/NonD family hydrolase
VANPQRRAVSQQDVSPEVVFRRDVSPQAVTRQHVSGQHPARQGIARRAASRRRAVDAVFARLLGQRRPLGAYRVAQVRTPMRDGAILLGDHFSPQGGTGRGTILIRTPYGRGFPSSTTHGSLLAAHGYHVLLQSVRGTFGSGGVLRPMAQEAEDGHDTVAWLREQPWFDGRLATVGGSYLGWTQWTLLQDPPPELRTAVVSVGPHDFHEAVWGTGAFTLGDFLGWSYQITRQEDGGGLRRVRDMLLTARRLGPAYLGVPLADSGETVLRGQAPWYREWVTHLDAADPWWEPYRTGISLHRVTAPVLLISGWQDIFLDQSLEQYATLRSRGVEAGLTVGPWTHDGVGGKGSAQLHRETLAWLDEHMAGGAPARKSPVRVYRTGEKRWHDMPSWPPESTPATFRLHGSGALTLDPASPAADSATPLTAEGATPLTADVSPAELVRFHYDPADPTPTVGGRTLIGSPGMKDNRALESRADVRTFTTDPLPTAVDVIGSPVLNLAITVDSPHADLFVRLLDVDEHGRSHNFSDHMRRLDPEAPAGETQRLTITLDPCYHRLGSGHRLRLLIAGGSFPRYARPIDPDGNLIASDRTIHCAGSQLTLPVAS